MVSPDVDVTNTYWALKNKFKLEVGVENTIDPRYPNIIWFKQGTYVFTSLNMNVQANNFTISLNGKDKMTLLNGELGGSINASTDFGQIEEYNNTYKKVSVSESKYKPNTYYYEVSEGKYKKDTSDKYTPGRKYYEVDEIIRDIYSIPIKDIIRNIVHTYAGEPLHNIILNDIDSYGLELLEYRGDSELYMLRNGVTGEVDNMTIKGNQEYYLEDGTKIKLKNIPEGQYYDRTETNNDDALKIYTTSSPSEDDVYYNVLQIKYGDTAGYRKTDLTFPGGLIANVGETVMSVLDKIKNMFADFEYFYDVDGRFVFQQKKTYVNKSWNTLEMDKDEVYADAAAYTSAATYSFEDGILLTAFTDAPNILNVRNDFSIWGTKKGATGADIPIHLRYAIDYKPEFYKSFDGKIYMTNEAKYNQMYEDKAEQIVEEFKKRLQNFDLQYTDRPDILKRADVHLDPPTKNEDGSWSPGWWDIRDWYNYYVTFKQEIPNGTMKWYSRNNLEGCQMVKDVLPTYYSNTNGSVWLVIVNPSKAPGTEGSQITSTQISLAHGSGVANENSRRECTYYTSYINEQGKLITAPVEPTVTKSFMSPYSGCSDNHTYLEFLINDIEKNGKLVYFYNPMFPGVDDYANALRDQAQQELENWEKLGEYNLVDWREIIYQMALDYYKHNQEEDFYLTLAFNNTVDGMCYYNDGITGYEAYYTDLQGFWRQIYNPEAIDLDKEEEGWIELDITIGVSTGKFSTKTGFHENVTKYPETLNFWFDFMNTKGDFGKYAVQAIGSRPKAVNDNNVKAIYYKDTPSVLFLTQKDYEDLVNNREDYDDMTGYTFIRLTSQMENYFTISAQGKSAKNALDDLLYQHTYATEAVNLTSVPLYHLQPNTRVFVNDKNTGISGEFIVSKITVPLQYNGTSAITTTKAVERIY